MAGPKAELAGDYTAGNLRAALSAHPASVGLAPIKINMVVISKVNDDELLDFAAKTIDEEWHIRFIEHMPFSDNEAKDSQFVSVSDMRQRIESLGELEPCSVSVGNLKPSTLPSRTQYWVAGSSGDPNKRGRYFVSAASRYSQVCSVSTT